MAIAFNSGSTILLGGGLGTYNKALTLGAGNLLVVTLYTQNDVQPTTIMWNTIESMGSPIGTAASVGSSKLRTWVLVGGTSGTHNVTITFAGSDPGEIGYVVYDYSGVATTTPVDGVVNDGSFSTGPTITVTSATNDLGIGAFASQSSIAGWSAVNGTTRINQAAINWGGIVVADRAGAASIQINGTISGADAWGSLGWNLNIAAAAGAIKMNSVQNGPNLGLPSIGQSILGIRNG